MVVILSPTEGLGNFGTLEQMTEFNLEMQPLSIALFHVGRNFTSKYNKYCYELYLTTYFKSKHVLKYMAYTNYQKTK